MNRNLSLTNSIDMVANSVALISGNSVIDILDLFLTKDDGNDILGIPPETLNTLQELAEALGNDSDFINTINAQLALKASISNTYDKVYINNLIGNYYIKSDIELKLLSKLDSDVINNYYTKTQSDNLIIPFYTKDALDTLLQTKSNSIDTYNKIDSNNLLNLKLNITAFDTAIALKVDISDVYLKDTI
jgi:hypothetical protein